DQADPCHATFLERGPAAPGIPGFRARRRGRRPRSTGKARGKEARTAAECADYGGLLRDRISGEWVAGVAVLHRRARPALRIIIPDRWRTTEEDGCRALLARGDSGPPAESSACTLPCLRSPCPRTR